MKGDRWDTWQVHVPEPHDTDWPTHPVFGPYPILVVVRKRPMGLSWYCRQLLDPEALFHGGWGLLTLIVQHMLMDVDRVVKSR